ncbi:MAG: hypothetical protein ACO1N9_12470 [Flavobacterium sp.]
MEAIRKIKCYKGLMAFMFVVFFFTAGMARNVAFKLNVIRNIEAHQQVKAPYGKQIVTSDSTPGSTAFSIEDEFKDADADDAEFIFFNDQATDFTQVTFVKTEYRQLTPHSVAYTDSLYDLFCNWKFHLA